MITDLHPLIFASDLQKITAKQMVITLVEIIGQQIRDCKPTTYLSVMLSMSRRPAYGFLMTPLRGSCPDNNIKYFEL